MLELETSSARRVACHLALVVIAACSSRRDPPEVRIASDASVPLVDAILDAAVDPGLIARLDILEPDAPAPKPILRKHRGGDCSTKYAPRPARDPNPMCRIPAGTFQMGGRLEAPPAHIVTLHPTPVSTTLRGFDIDQFEVTAPQVALFLNAHGNDCPGLHAKIVSLRMTRWPTKRGSCVGRPR